MKFKMKSLLILLLLLFFIIGLAHSDGSVGDFEAIKPDALSKEYIEKFYTTETVVGRDVESDQCSSMVLERRKPYQNSVSNIQSFAKLMLQYLDSRWSVGFCNEI